MNKFFANGNLTRDPEIRYTNSGLAVCEFGLAINKGKDDKKKTVFVDVVCWDKVAERIGKTLSKGNAVIIDGELDMDTWKDKESGKNRSKLKITAYAVYQLEAFKPSSTPADTATSYAQPPVPEFTPEPDEPNDDSAEIPF